MKIDRFYVVTKPTENSELGDVVFAASVANLELQFRGGLKADDIHAVYTMPEEAEAEGSRILAASKKYFAELAKVGGKGVL